MNGLQYMTSSLFFRGALARLRRLGHHLRHYVLPRRPRVDLELPTSRAEKAALDADETAALREYNDHTALIFTLNLCFVLAGLALFTSLLAFRDQAAWDTGCGASSRTVFNFVPSFRPVSSVRRRMGRHVFSACAVARSNDFDD